MIDFIYKRCNISLIYYKHKNSPLNTDISSYLFFWKSTSALGPGCVTSTAHLTTLTNSTLIIFLTVLIAPKARCVGLKWMSYYKHYLCRHLKETAWEFKLQVQEPIFHLSPTHILISCHILSQKFANSSVSQ